MRSMLAVAAIAAVMTISTSASAQQPVTSRVTTAPLNVRSGPDTAYRILGLLPKGTRVEVKSQQGTWSQIAFGTGTAWLPTAFLALLPASSATLSSSPDKIQVSFSAGGVQASFGGLQLRINLTPQAGALPSPTPVTAPTASTPAASTPAASMPTATTPAATPPALSGNVANGLRTQTGTTGSTTPSAAGAGSTGSTSLGAPEPTQTTTPQTGTAPGAPASTTPLPASSTYAPTGTVPPGQTAGYIQLRASGAGHYGYGTAARKYGRPALIYGLERISAGFASTGHKMGVGDISQNGGGAISGHASHRLGVDVDVRPCRKDKAQQPVTWQQTAVYDRAATQTLGNLFGRELKLTNFFFNDRQVNVRTKTSWPNHDNHFHARINPN